MSQIKTRYQNKFRKKYQFSTSISDQKKHFSILCYKLYDNLESDDSIYLIDEKLYTDNDLNNNFSDNNYDNMTKEKFKYCNHSK